MQRVSYLQSRLTLEEYLEMRYKQDKGTGRLSSSAASNAYLFCMDQFNRSFVEVMKDMKSQFDETNQIDTVLLFLQKFVTWMHEPHLDLLMQANCTNNGTPCVAKRNASIRGYIAQTRLILKKVSGISISSEDVKDYGLSYPDEEEAEEVEPFTKEELKMFIDKAYTFRRKVMYRCIKDFESRIGATVQLVKKDFNTKVRPIAVTFRKGIMKKKNGIAYTNVKYVTEEDTDVVLQLLDMCESENSLVFGTSENIELAKNNEEKAFARMADLMGMGDRYSHNNRRKKNLHSIKSMTFTIAREAVDLDYANAYGDHVEYCRNYLRQNDEKKISYFRKMEPYLALYTKIKVVTDDKETKQKNSILEEQNKKLEEQNIRLEKQINKIAENQSDMSSKLKHGSKMKLSPEVKGKIEDILKEYGFS